MSESSNLDKHSAALAFSVASFTLLCGASFTVCVAYVHCNCLHVHQTTLALMFVRLGASTRLGVHTSVPASFETLHHQL